MSEGIGGVPRTLGQFEITGELGRGGMAVVFMGYQPSLDRQVAIKTLPADMTQNREMVSRFKREVGAMVALNHTNIVQIIDSGEEQGLYYYAMEFVDGPTLKDLLKEEGLTVDQAFDVALQICDGLAYAHKKGIVHRDIKPANVLWERSTELAKIADFGIARLMSKDTEMITLTATSVGMGTMNYMAPEQKTDAGKVDHRADIYSVGVVLYEMFTGGKLPMGRFKMPSELTPGLPKALDQVVGRCLEADPDDRFDSLAEVHAGLSTARQAAATSGSQVLRSVRSAAEKTLTAVAGQGQGGVVAGLCLVVAFLLTAAAGTGYYVFFVRGKDDVAVNGESPSPSETSSPEVSVSADPSPSDKPSPSPSDKPSPSPSDKPSPSPSDKPSPSPSDKPSPSPSDKPSPSPSPTPTNKPSPTPTNEPSPTPTNKPSPTPTNKPSPSPSVVQLSPELRQRVAESQALLAEIDETEQRWGRLPNVRSGGELEKVRTETARLEETGNLTTHRLLGGLVLKLRTEALRDLDRLLTNRRKQAEDALGINEHDMQRIARAVSSLESAATEEKLARFSLVLDDLARAELSAYRFQAMSAYAVAVHRATTSQLEQPGELIRKAKEGQIHEQISSLRQAIELLAEAGEPETIDGLSRVAEYPFDEGPPELRLAGATSICPGARGGVVALARGEGEGGGAYLLWLVAENGRFEVRGRQQVFEAAHWVATAGQEQGVSSYWVGPANADGPQDLRRYEFDEEGKPAPRSSESLLVPMGEKEFLLDLASGADGALYVLTTTRVLVYLGRPGARSEIGSVSLNNEFTPVPLTRRVAPMRDGQLIVSGLDTNVMKTGRPDRGKSIWHPKNQRAWEFQLRGYNWQSGVSRQVRSTGSAPCAIVGVGETVLGIGYETGGRVLSFKRMGRPTDATTPQGSNYLANDVTYVRGQLYVIDKPVGEAQHVRQRLTLYR